MNGNRESAALPAETGRQKEEMHGDGNPRQVVADETVTAGMRHNQVPIRAKPGSLPEVTRSASSYFVTQLHDMRRPAVCSHPFTFAKVYSRNYT